MLQRRYPDLEYCEEGRWVRLASYPLPTGWNREATDVAFQIGVQGPGTAPYGFYVPVGLRYEAKVPASYTEPASTQPPFAGTWGFFSWGVDGPWFATADVVTGSNYSNYARTFRDRFREGV